MLMYAPDKLNVADKTRSNPFNWRGQFTPQFIEYLLEQHRNNVKTVADPFSGSGTVLFEASKHHLDVFGCEINPSAYAMSKFFEFCKRNLKDRCAMSNGILNILHSCSDYFVRPVYIKEEARRYRDAYKYLISFSQKLLEHCIDKPLKVLLLNILFKMENMKELSLGDAWDKAHAELSAFLFSLPETDSYVKAHLADARIIDTLYPQKVDLFITSPPYINVFNYHQNHRIIMELLDFNILDVAKSEFGSNRKHRGNRFLTVIQYCLDMAMTLRAMRNCVTEHGIAVFVVGRESNVRKTSFKNGEILLDLATATKTFTLIDRSERYFLNKFGKNIYEDVLTFQPSEAIPDTFECAREIAEKHLRKGLELAPDESMDDLQAALKSIENILPSPIFKYRRTK